jgi:hypothetical protein
VTDHEELPVTQPPYGQPHGQQPYYPPQQIILPPTSGAATAAMVLGIIGVVSCGFTSIPAIILGHMGERATVHGQKGGRGQAITGLVLGYLIAAPWIMFWLMVMAGVASAPFLPATPSTAP